MGKEELIGKLIGASSSLEKELRRLGVEGTGLKELVQECDKIDENVKKRLEKAIHIRNKIVHEDTDYSEDKILDQIRNMNDVAEDLKRQREMNDLKRQWQDFTQTNPRISPERKSRPHFSSPIFPRELDSQLCTPRESRPHFFSSIFLGICVLCLSLILMFSGNVLLGVMMGLVSLLIMTGYLSR